MSARIREEDITRLATQVGEACVRRRVDIVTAESCTGGGVAEAITRIAGSSAWFDRGFVTYANEAKEALLGVSRETLEAHGAVSQEVVREMAAGALERSNARVSAAVTGIAGPGGATPGKPVGLVWLAWGVRDGDIQSRVFRFRGNRLLVRRQAVAVALQGIVDLLAIAENRSACRAGCSA
jgi:nicotinamide-nucleotide amidase